MYSSELLNKFEKLVMKANFELLENKLFQPIGIELSSVSIILETLDNYTFKGIENNEEIEENDFPLAYYRADTDSIHIFIEHKEFKKRTTENEQYALLIFLLFHEANHRLLMHIKRGENKENQLWNIASDYEIHNTYYMYSNIIKNDTSLQMNLIHKYMKDYIDHWLILKDDPEMELGLFEEDFLENVAEEIYYTLLNSKKTKEVSFECNNAKCKVTFTEYTLPNGKKIKKTDVNFPNAPKSNLSNNEKEQQVNNELTRQTLMKNNFQKYAEKCKGTLSNKCKTFLKKLFHVKIDWKKILRNSLQTILEKSDYFSWAKPRTSLFGLNNMPYLPSQIDDSSSYGTLVIARDESGSMTEKDCEIAAGIIMDAKNHYKKIIIIKHDTDISSINEFEEINDTTKKMLLTRDSHGGTSHKKVFEWINEYEKNHKDDEKISCCIFITDMYSDIEEYQHILNKHLPKIYLTMPSSVETFKNNVNGILIPIED